MIDHCGECICRYCRWKDTDNCLHDNNRPCAHCHKGSKEHFICDGFEVKPTRVKNAKNK